MGTGSTFSYTPANGDVVTATLASSAACATPATATAMAQATVINMETPSVSIAAMPGNRLCQGSVATYMATPVAGGDAPVYTWVSGGVTSTITGPVFAYTPHNGDVVFAKLLSSYRCPTANNVTSNNITMTVDSIHVPQVTIIANPGTDISQNQQVTFTTTVGNAGASPLYQWLINGNPVPGANAATFIHGNFNDGDSVTCVVTATGACGYTTINSVSMHVTPTTGISQVAGANASMRLIPNPNNGEFVLSGTIGAASQEVSFEVTDMLGQVVYTGRVMTQNGSLNERVHLNSNLANGMYLMNIRSGSEHTVISFVVKQ
jgi:hypothetical protein